MMNILTIGRTTTTPTPTPTPAANTGGSYTEVSYTGGSWDGSVTVQSESMMNKNSISMVLVLKDLI